MKMATLTKLLKMPFRPAAWLWLHLALLALCLGQSAFAQPNLTNGWSAYVSFNDGTATDNSGNGLLGTTSGRVTPTNGASGKGMYGANTLKLYANGVMEASTTTDLNSAYLVGNPPAR